MNLIPQPIPFAVYLILLGLLLPRSLHRLLDFASLNEHAETDSPRIRYGIRESFRKIYQKQDLVNSYM